MELKEGMYVRTKDGIAKYLGLGKNVLTINESNQFKHYANQHLFDNSIFDVGHDWGDTLSNEEFKSIEKYTEKDPSFNLIDSIEVGDYVNGTFVLDFDTLQTGEKAIIVDGLITYGWGQGVIPANEVKDIVTKEQFNACKYVVERDK